MCDKLKLRHKADNSVFLCPNTEGSNLKLNFLKPYKIICSLDLMRVDNQRVMKISNNL